MSSFSDDFLDDLKQTVAQDVAAEQARIEAEKAAQAAAAADAARRAEEAHRVEMTARLEAEARRRQLATEARARKARPAGVEPDAPGRPSGRRPAVAAPALEPLQVQAPAERHGAGFYFVVMGLPLLCITAITVTWLLKSPAPVQLNPVQPPVVLEVAPQPPVAAPTPEVAAPGAALDAADTPVSAQVPGEAERGSKIDKGDEKARKDDEKTRKDDKKTTRPRRVRKPTPDPGTVAAEPNKPGRIRGRLNLTVDLEKDK